MSPAVILYYILGGTAGIAAGYVVGYRNGYQKAKKIYNH